MQYELTIDGLTLDKYIEQEVEKRIKEYPVYIKNNGKKVDIENMIIECGQIDIDISDSDNDLINLGQSMRGQ